MQRPVVIGVLVLANSLFLSDFSCAQEVGSNADQAVSAEEAAENGTGGATAIHCGPALSFDAGDEEGILNAEVSYAAESFLSAVLVSTSNESFTHGDAEILMGTLASLGVGANSSYSADIDMNGYDGPLWVQVLVLTEDGALIASDIREVVRHVPAAEEAPSADESGDSAN